MINLLPPEDKRQIRAARSNTLLLRYNILTLGALVFLLVAAGIVYFYLVNVRATAERTIEDNQARVAGYQKVRTEADTFRANLSTAKQILDKEVAYSNVVLEISKLLPRGVILRELRLDSQTFGTPTTLSAQARSYESAIALKDAFSSSPLFSDVHFQSITSEGSDGESGSYPYSVTLGLTISKEAIK